jgi:hypothetical protein
MNSGEKEGLLHVNFDCESANQLEERSFFKHFFQYFSDKSFLYIIYLYFLIFPYLLFIFILLE